MQTKYGTTIEIIDNTERTEEQELVEDLIQIVTLRIPVDIFNRLNEIAKNKGISCNSLIASILFDYLNQKSS